LIVINWGLLLNSRNVVIGVLDYENPDYVFIFSAFISSSRAVASGGKMADAADVLFYRKDSPASDTQREAFGSLCQALLSSNRFLYLE
jgi:hypothetical protein